MNREILFRAKHIHTILGNEHLNGIWVHGYLGDENYGTGWKDDLRDPSVEWIKSR